METSKTTSYDRLKKTLDDDVTFSPDVKADDNGNQKYHDYEPTASVEGVPSDSGHKYHGYGTLISVAFAFLLVFVGYLGTEALQTHINPEGGLGTTAVSIVYGAFFLSCFGFGPAVVGHFGPKWPVVIAWTCYMLFVLANFYPRTWTLYPAAALIGLAGGPVWISMGVYTTSLALEHAALNKKPPAQVLSFFNGIFIGIFFFQFPTSALISAIVFFVADLQGKNTGPGKETTPGIWGGNQTSPVALALANHTHDVEQHPDITIGWFTNATMTTPGDHHPKVSVCGAKYCAYLDHHTSEIDRPDDMFIYINLGIFTACIGLGMILLAFQRSVRPPDHQHMSVKDRLKALIRVLRDWRWLLLAPTFAVCGIMQGMAVNTFSQAFVNCTLNIRWVAYVLTLRGLTCMTTSFVSGKMAEWLPQWLLLLSAYLIELGVLLVWIMWTPTADLGWLFFIVQGAEGIGSGSLRVHATALLGYLFSSDQEVAFAHLNMMVALAACFIMALANFLCFGPQAYIAMAILITSMVCYTALNIFLRRQKRHSEELSKEEDIIKEAEEKKPYKD